MNKRVEIAVHIAVWLILFLTPLTFMNRGNGVSLAQYLMTCMSPLLMMVVFYANYLWLTPHYFVTGKHRYFWITNIIMVISLGIFLHFWMSMTHGMFETGRHPHRHEPSSIRLIFFMLRDIFNLAMSAAIAIAIQLAMRWQKTVQARHDAEAARTEAELKTLRNQINPHFLLNTLNNIYALTTFDTNKAQEAIQQLSKMLRHLLYDDQQSTITIEKEVEFLENYISLMKIRLPQSVEVTTQFSIHDPYQEVAPMILISLIENAFKHGISPTEPSFIHISITTDDHLLVADISNSNHPKTATDQSGHGIGLKQVQQRLDLAYPNHYVWEKGVTDDGNTYYSKIQINI